MTLVGIVALKSDMYAVPRVLLHVIVIGGSSIQPRYSENVIRAVVLPRKKN